MQKVLRGICFGIALIMLSPACPAALADSANIQCDIRLSETSVAVGESVSATINVSGGFAPYSIQCAWEAASNRGHFTFIENYTVIQNGATVSCTPTFGTKLIVSVTVTDAIGQYESFYKEIGITGGDTNPIHCTIATDKAVVAVYEPVNATVNVSGGVPPLDIQCAWEAASNRGSFTFIENYAVIQNGATVSCTPTFGTQLIVSVTVTDAIGQYESFYQEVGITGGDTNPIHCTIATDKDAVAVGEPVNATVNVSGGVPPLDIQCAWEAASNRGSFTFIKNYAVIQNGATVSCTPTFGTQLIVSVTVTDAIGQYESFYKPIRMIGTPSHVFLPTSQTVWQPGSHTGLTTTVDADYGAFLNIAVDGAYVDVAEYSVAPGSTVITLHPAYLGALSAGTHILTAYFQTGYAEMQFLIGGAGPGVGDTAVAEVPKTGDAATPLLWAALIPLLCVCLFLRLRRRKRV